MRTRANIHLDADAYDFASAYASAKGIPLGAAVSELLRQLDRGGRPSAGPSTLLEQTERGYLVRKNTGEVITSEMVKELSEDEFV